MMKGNGKRPGKVVISVFIASITAASIRSIPNSQTSNTMSRTQRLKSLRN